MAGLLKKKSLIDTGFMFAVLDKKDVKHEICSLAYERETAMLLPEVVLPELAYLVIRSLGYDILTTFLSYVAAGNLPLISIAPEDLRRASEILKKYADAKIDFVDCVIMAIAERLNIQRILTVDRRDFGLFCPRHCDHFEIIP
ncbi:MAG: PIN domain-containing protein [Pyrinomonadaceae bacterium]|nr:PIN domain-containing protein [Pyrinomonadaceae bacterium]